MCYKVSNMRYKVCNKKNSYRKGKNIRQKEKTICLKRKINSELLWTQPNPKPFIAERFGAQTVQQYLSNIQSDKYNAEGLKGFLG